MTINDQILQLVAAAKAAGLDSPDSLADEIRARWSQNPAPPTPLKLDEDGRYYVTGSRIPWLSDLPIHLGMDLTTRQLGNIMSNCGVDAKGVRKPAAHLGYETGTGTPDNPITTPVSWLVARQFWNIPPGGPYPKLSPDTRRARFTTLAEHLAYVAANPWVQ